MPRFVEQEVRERARNPSDSSYIDLLIGFEGEVSTVEELVEQGGGEVLDTLPFRTISATVPETAINLILDHPSIETVELDSGMETLQGN